MLERGRRRNHTAPPQLPANVCELGNRDTSPRGRRDARPCGRAGEPRQCGGSAVFRTTGSGRELRRLDRLLRGGQATSAMHVSSSGEIANIEGSKPFTGCTGGKFIE